MSRLPGIVGSLLVFLGGIGLAGGLAARGAEGDLDSVKDSACQVGDCADVDPQLHHPSCPDAVGICSYKNAATGLHWCKGSQGSTCYLYVPYDPQYCDGVCTCHPSLSCRSRGWNLCYLT